jgi:hypothetical protein
VPRIVILLLISLVAGCTDYLAERQARLTRFVGAPEPVLINEMGVPSRSYVSEGKKYLAYEETREELLRGTPGMPIGPPFYGMRAGGIPPQIVTLTCETTFVVSEGVVRSFSLRGNACG